MKSDLAYAQASLDWAKANFPAFEEKLNSWLHENIKTQLIRTESETAHNVIVAVEKEPLPLRFSVEAGVLINSMRSALDMVAWTVFKRETLLYPKEVYFPVAESEAHWRNGNYKGSKFIGQLGGTERRIFESLRLYRGGNEVLCWLHDLDVARKHRRLLSAAHEPQKLTIIGDFKQDEFVPLNNSDGFIRAGNGETVLGLWAKGATNPKLGYTPEIVVDEPEFALREPIMPLLGEFSRQTQAVIKLFDY